MTSRENTRVQVLQLAKDILTEAYQMNYERWSTTGYGAVGSCPTVPTLDDIIKVAETLGNFSEN